MLKLCLHGNLLNCTLPDLDIDECVEDTDGCAQVCSNTEGSYVCSCNSGYRLASDGRWCTGKSVVDDNTSH